jgi:hypothetical protein
MLLRHAAAFALVGRYLIMPAPGNEGAPLRYRSHLQSYDTAAQCGMGKDKWYAQNEREGFKLKGFAPEQVKASMLCAECIEGDDPRLKEK